MKTLAALAVAFTAALAPVGRASGQTTHSTPPPTPAAERPSAEPNWAFSAAAYVYFLPEQSDYVQPTVMADHHALHLEARYSYENLLTASAWVGYNLAGGEALAWELTPMVGGVFGRTMGVAPGFEGSLSYWKLELYSEGEYVFDWGDTSQSFFYSWSELTVAPVAWARLGLVAQRTRTYSSGRALERGLLLGFAYEFATLTGYVFNPDDKSPVFVLALGLHLDS